jgi:hypothetical protein
VRRPRGDGHGAFKHLLRNCFGIVQRAVRSIGAPNQGCATLDNRACRRAARPECVLVGQALAAEIGGSARNFLKVSGPPSVALFLLSNSHGKQEDRCGVSPKDRRIGL